MKVLVACERSGRVRGEFLSRGHDAWSCDLEPSETPGPHIRTNVLDVLDENWDLMIGHPPCTRLCNSGVRWLAERNLWSDLDEACRFFNQLKEARIPKICLENPIPHGYAVKQIGEYTQRIQPWQFGDPFTKATCLWLKGLPRLVPDYVGKAPRNVKAACHLESPGPNRSMNRARTYPGIAKAMAEQWG